MSAMMALFSLASTEAPGWYSLLGPPREHAVWQPHASKWNFMSRERREPPGDDQNVHHAPGLIGRIPVQKVAETLAHRAARAVAANSIARFDRVHVTVALGIGPADRCGHRMGLVGGICIDPQIDEATIIVRLEPAWRIAHDIEKEIVYARLIEDDMGKFR